MLRVGIDVGGTFTDLFAYDDASGATYSAKAPTTVSNQARGAMDSIEAAELALDEVDFLAHGTTTGLNALIERKGAATGLLTTDGFRDVLEIMRTDRASGYDLSWRKPAPYVPRWLRREIPERVLHDGTIEVELDEARARTEIDLLVAAGVQSVAISFLHSYANPAHERRLLELIGEIAPDMSVSLSSEINAEIREFERTNTVVVDAYIKPIMVRYIERLVDDLRAGGFAGRLFLMQGSGGLVTPSRACEKPIVTLSSGPAAGAIAAARIAAVAGFRDIVTFDVGGTSTDVALIHEGKPFLNLQKQIEWGLPARIPLLDVQSVGAGGGSIGWIDQGGALKMGPQSAGASPGPVCYGMGGTAPTLSDALLVKGILGASLADGRLELDVEAARSQVQGTLADPLDLPMERIVDGMVEIAQANMANAVRSVSIWKGLDPRDLTLVAFGGAGGLVAAPVAAMLDIPTVVIPPVPGNSCAMGTLMADFQEDTAVAYLARVDEANVDAINERLARLRENTVTALVAQGAEESQVELVYLADMRYHGQIHELRIPLGEYPITWETVEAAIAGFESTDEEIYTIRLEGGLPEFVSLRVTARVSLPTYEPPLFTTDAAGATPTSTREVTDGGQSWTVPVYDRYSLPAGTELAGPAILQEAGSTTWVAPHMSCAVDENGNLIIYTDHAGFMPAQPILARTEA
jgi:N-methylhydantoinase A